MIRRCRLAAALLLLGALTGCVTSTVKITPAEPGRISSSGARVTHFLEGMNTGVYLFYWIPLWSGNPRNPNQRDYDLLKHQVSEKDIYRMFDSVAKRMGKKPVEDIRVRTRSSGVWTLWIFWKRSVRGTGSLVVRKSPKAGKPKQ
ncbi:MAG: replication initiation protein [Lentisphaeria bacterium]|nr:replication initiation protein [Lentisphaeria bacterium]